MAAKPKTSASKTSAAKTSASKSSASKTSAAQRKKPAPRAEKMSGPKGRSGGAGTQLTQITLTDNSGCYGNANVYVSTSATGAVSTNIVGPGKAMKGVPLPVNVTSLNLYGIKWARAAIWATDAAALGNPVIFSNPIATPTAGYATLSIVVGDGTGAPQLSGTT